MDTIDLKLLNELQDGLPIEKDPYSKIAQSLDIERKEIVNRVKKLIKKGYIRRFGGIFNTRGMGYQSTLVGVHVPDHLFSDVATYINKCKGVTHNYRRTNYLNMWFTLTVLHEEEKEELFKRLNDEFGLEEVTEFPTLKYFKLKVFFDMEGRRDYG